MFGIDPLTASTLLILASGGGAVSCPDHDPTKINMIPRTEDVKYDFTQTLAELQGLSMDTVDPYSFHGETITQGYMNASVGLEHKVKFGQATLKNYNAACIWYEDITIELKIDPTIVVAKELSQNQCMRKAVVEHELKHVRVDREIVNKYARVMGKKLYSDLKSRGFSAGPFPVERAQEIATKMQHVISQILELEVQKMNIERTELQREVDSLDEYNRVGELCPSFEKQKQKLYGNLKKKKTE